MFEKNKNSLITLYTYVHTRKIIQIKYIFFFKTRKFNQNFAFSKFATQSYSSV